MQRIRIGVLYGGESSEHEVSLQSAKNIINALDREKYEIIPIAISKTGQWLLGDIAELFLNAHDPKNIQLSESVKTVALYPRGKHGSIVATQQLLGEIDVIFPVLHGPLGEDGTVQGLLRLLHIAFVGPDVLGSAVGMDKDVSKRLLREAGLPVTDFLVFHRSEVDTIKFEQVVEHLKLPFFVKAANQGSSVSISKVHDHSEFAQAIDEAFIYDEKILIEAYVEGRELEVAVLGNENLKASVPGEIIPTHEFYSYEAKYLDENGARCEIPAQLTDQQIEEIQELAIRTTKTLCCEGMARVDFFLSKDGRLVINEINTIPGFTNISMYPKLWEASGLSYSKLLDELISLALKRHKREELRKTVR